MSYSVVETRQVSNIVNSIKDGNLTRLKTQISGFSINRVLDDTGNTALHYAIIFQKCDVIKYLLSIGADENIRNYFGDNCRTLACRYGSTVFFEVNTNIKNEEIGILKKENTELKHTVTELRTSYDKLNKKFIEVSDENRGLKRKNEFLEESYNQLCSKHRKV